MRIKSVGQADDLEVEHVLVCFWWLFHTHGVFSISAAAEKQQIPDQ